ncbi:MAG: helix-turn-helix domain-containing protein [Opitutaceae bacterium]
MNRRTYKSSDGDPWKVADVATALGVSSRTIEHLKARFVEEGLEAALERKRRVKPPKLIFGGEFDARLTALACSPAPAGRARWTVRLLAEKAVELKIAHSVSTMTVQRSLKKPTAASSEQILEDSTRGQRHRPRDRAKFQQRAAVGRIEISSHTQAQFLDGVQRKAVIGTSRWPM